MTTLKAIALAVQAGVPTLLWGEPGTGKTSFCKQFAVALDCHLETVIASLREPSDFGGLPYVRHDGSVALAPPAWAKDAAAHPRSLVLFDEITTAPPAVQNALLRVVLEGVVGDLRLPPSVMFLAAANPVHQAAGGWDLGAPFANRFCHISWTLVSDVWIEGMITGWPSPVLPLLPPSWHAGVPAARALVASFIKVRPDLLQRVPENETQAGCAWPSGRSWDNAATLLAAAESAGSGDETRSALVAGCVGDAAALAFFSFVQELDLPNPEDLLARPDAFVVPRRGDQVFAVLAALTSAVLSRNTPERWTSAWKVLGKVADAGQADAAIISARALAQAKPVGADAPPEAQKIARLLERAGLDFSRSVGV